MYQCAIGYISRLWDKLRLRLYLLLSQPFDDPTDYKARFFRFGIPLILKATHRTVSTEADALRFLNRVRPLLPIPRLLDSLVCDGVTYTLMTRIRGKTLLELEEGEVTHRVMLDVLDVMHSLWRCIASSFTVRLNDASLSIPQPPEHLGKVMLSSSGHGLPSPVRFREILAGPFDSTLTCYNAMSWKMPGATDATRAALAADRIVFVHTDLRMYNILVENGRLSGIVDWEDAGWLPMHWQLALLRRPCLGCQGIWVRQWREKIWFDEVAEAAYDASNSVVIYSLAC